MKKQIQISIWLVILAIIVTIGISWKHEAIESAERTPLDRKSVQVDGDGVANRVPSVTTQQGYAQEDKILPVSQLPFNHRTACVFAGWKWHEDDSRTWCETYVPCGRPVPACPDGNAQWHNIVESSRICTSTNAHGYRVFCHVE